MKRYVLEYTSDDPTPHSVDMYNHVYGYASTMQRAKGYIKDCRESYLQRYNPRNFRIYDTWADVDPVTNYVPCVYQED